MNAGYMKWKTKMTKNEAVDSAVWIANHLIRAFSSTTHTLKPGGCGSDNLQRVDRTTRLSNFGSLTLELNPALEESRGNNQPRFCPGVEITCSEHPDWKAGPFTKVDLPKAEKAIRDLITQ